MANTLPAVGSKAPAFALPSHSGRTVKLSEARGKKVVLYFYPKDNTPGCTREACGFQGARSQLTKEGAVVLGVSCDSAASHQRFADKFGLTFTLLSDQDAAVSRAYGVYTRKSMYGKTFWGIERTTFIIDEDGRIAKIFPRVSVDGHTAEVLQALRELGRTPAAAGQR